MLAAAASVFVASCAATGTVTTGPGYPASGLEWNVERPGADYRSFELVTPSPETCQATCMNEPQCVAFTYMNPGVQGPNARCWLKNAVPSAVPQGCCVSGTKYGDAPPPAAAPPAPPPSAWQGAPATPPPPAPAPPPSTWQGAPATPPPAAAPAPAPPSPWQGAPATPPPPAPAPPPPSSGWQGRPTTPPPAPPPPPPAAPRQWEPQTDRPGMDYKGFDLPAPRPELCRDACWRDGSCRAFTYVRPGVQGPNARCALKSSVPPARPADCCLSGVK